MYICVDGTIYNSTIRHLDNGMFQRITYLCLVASSYIRTWYRDAVVLVCMSSYSCL